MSKRKNRDFIMPSPKKEKKVEIPQASENSSDSEQEYEEDHVGVEDTKVDESPYAYEPDEFRIMVEKFNAFLGTRPTSAATVQNMEKIATEWASEEKNSNVDAGLFLADYRKYLRSATKNRNFHLDESTPVLLSYLGSDKALPDFNTLPEKPLPRIQLYIKKHNLQVKGIGGMMKDAHEKMRNDVKGSQEVDEKIKEMSLQYAPLLQEFLNNHPNLTFEQKRSIENKIKSINRKYTPKQTVQKTPKKSAKKEPTTAFALFCKSKAEKYRDLSEEDREKKLRKKFDKLSEEARDIFHSLALNM